MKKLLAIGLVLMFAPVAWAGFFEDFESYATTDDMDDLPTVVGPWVQMYPETPFELDTTKGYGSNNSVHPPAPNSNSTHRMYRNFGADYAGTDESPITFSIMIQLGADNDWWTREYVELRGYEGEGYGDGGLEELIAMGCTSSGADTSKFNDRVLSGEGWANFSLAKDLRWIRLEAVIKTDTIDFYYKTPADLAPVFDHTSSRTPGVTFDCVVVGSGLSSRTDVSFDNIRVTPEPASLVLLAMGGLALLRRR
jgi:hypothetical protein